MADDDLYLDDDRFLPPERPWSKEDLDRLFPRQRRNLRCQRCTGMLVLRDGKNGIFYGCENWRNTQCKGSLNCNQQTAELLGFTTPPPPTPAVFREPTMDQVFGNARYRRQPGNRPSSSKTMQQNVSDKGSVKPKKEPKSCYQLLDEDD